MKKILLLTLLFVFCIAGYSQSGTFGVRGGYNISNLDFDGTPSMENKHRNSFYIGFFADYRLSNGVSLVPELQFSAEGAKEEKLHLDYIQAPILFKFNLSKRIRFGVGPQMGWKVYKLNDEVRDLAFSGVGGFDFKINEVLFIDARYTYGLTSIFNESYGIEAKNTNIQIGIGYQF
ncbi:porin family protein [Flavobacteriaceae bacterium XHP0103]|uniref:porin family protein n=1 Tax=Marixanthotalea marina TaxID=2844359 RepID=UPI002989D0AF|nr:porin family protein [Marixanthotalea marina]MBU3823085.1 porin family protein [Marixanthotalea marina]